MKTVNVMQLAWKIHKANLNLTNFYWALKMAWKIVKQATVKMNDRYIQLSSKTMSKFKLYTEHTVPKRNTIQIKNDAYQLNMIVAELKLYLN